MKAPTSPAQGSRDRGRRSTILDEDVDDFSTEREIAALLKYRSTNTLQRQRQRGVGPPYIKLPTGRVVYRRVDVLDWIERHRVVPGRA